MDAKFRKNLEDAYEALCEYKKEKKIDEETYYKGVVSIAYEFVADALLSEGVLLLQECPSDYFVTEFVDQMHEDKEFAKICYSLAKVLKENNMTALEEFRLTTYKSASA